jgi:hypothetical protein
MEIRIVREREFDFSTHLSKTRTRKSIIGSCRRVIECTDWDERILTYEKWLNGFCWGSIAISVVCLLPVIVHIVQK